MTEVETLVITSLLVELVERFQSLEMALQRTVLADVKEAANRWSDLDFKVIRDRLASGVVAVDMLSERLERG